MLFVSISSISLTGKSNGSLSTQSSSLSYSCQSNNSCSLNKGPLPLANTLESVYQLLPKPQPATHNTQLIQTPKLL